MPHEQLQKLIGECVERRGAHVIDIAVHGREPRTTVEVYIDAEEGVTTGLCSEISRDINKALAAGPMLQPLQQLTVSSPGSDRPLRYPWQYRKHVGRTLAVRDVAGQDRTGRLTAVDEAGITLEDPRGESGTIPFAAIDRAVVRTPW